MDIINLDLEFTYLVKLIDQLWDGVDSPVAHEAMIIAFNQGLEDGKLWVDQYATMRIANVLNGNDEIESVLKNRRDITFNDHDGAYLDDALYCFNSDLEDGIKKIYGSVTAYGRWDYSKSASALCTRLGERFGRLDVTPRDQTKAEQLGIIKDYPGEQAGEAGSFPTPERLLKDYVEYSRDGQGYSLFRSLFSTVYSHALYCSQLKNTQELVNDLLPIYQKRDDPLNFDNGDEILSIALQNRFVSLVHELKPFTFSSSEEYFENQEKAKAHKAKYAHETSAEKETREQEWMKNMTARLLDKIDSEIDEEDNRVNAFVDRIAPEFSAFSLSA